MERSREFSVAATRVLPVIVLADVSGSMKADGKIRALNFAVREMIEAFREEDDLRAEIHVAVITFGGASASLHLPLTPAASATWTDMPADGQTPLGAAFDAARSLLEDKTRLPSSSYRPTLVLVSDGVPTDGEAWKTALAALLATDRGAKTFRMAMGIGSDADVNVLRAFLGDPQGRVYQAQDARQIRRFFEVVTMTVTSRSRSVNPNVAPVPAEEGWDV